MKLCAQMSLLIALAAALTFTYWPASTQVHEPIPGTGPVLRPHPISLRTCAKDVIVRAVIDDGLSLPDAAALCGEVHRLLPVPSGLAEYPPLDLSRTTAEEHLCRQVIGWVESQGNAADTVARLEAEFCNWLCQGAGRLPDPAALCPAPAELLEQAQAEWLAQTGGKRRSRVPHPVAE
jgi:hypothetical protein